jgi:hypothetical protein
MNLRTLPLNTPLDVLFTERVFTLSALRATPLGAPYVADFVALHTEWLLIQERDISLTTDLSDADARIVECESHLRDLANKVSSAVLSEVKNDRKNPYYVHFFGSLRASDFRRPIRDAKIGVFEAWVPTLFAATNPALKALGGDVQAAALDAKAAVTARSDAENALTFFREISDRRAFVASFNGKRKDTYVALAKLPHDRPELHLPTTYADGFFAHRAASKRSDVIAIDVAIGKHEDAIQLLTEQKTELLAIDAAKAAVASEKAKTADAAALAAAEKDVADAEAKAAAIRAKLAADAPAPAGASIPAAVPAPAPAPAPAPTATSSPIAPTSPTS